MAKQGMCRSFLLLVLLTLPAACDSGSDLITGSGTIEAVSHKVVAKQGGRVLERLVGAGDSVDADEALLQLDPLLIESAIAEAQALVTLVQAQRDQLQAGVRPEERSLARLRLEQLQAQWQAASLARAQAEALFDGPGASGSNPGQTALAALAMEQLTLAELQAESETKVEQASYAKLRAGASDEQILAAEAALLQAESARDQLLTQREDLTLRAPRDGVILEGAAMPGEIVAPGSILFRLADLDALEITIYVSEADLEDVREGQDAEVTVDAIEDETFDAEVIRIAESAEFTPSNVQTRDQRANLVFAVTLKVKDKGDQLLPGMPAEVELEQR